MRKHNNKTIDNVTMQFYAICPHSDKTVVGAFRVPTVQELNTGLGVWGGVKFCFWSFGGEVGGCWGMFGGGEGGDCWLLGPTPRSYECIAHARIITLMQA